jgi:hypothetical protein
MSLVLFSTSEDSLRAAGRMRHIDDEASEIVLLTHWIGGVHTELRLPRRRRGQRNSISADIVCTENLIRVDVVMESPKLAE